jgi:nicotinamide-nucleotide amidase
MFSEALLDRAARLLARCRAEKRTLATAESCTGGLVIGLLTEIAGSSDVVDRGFVTYSNGAKRELLGVSDALLETHGAVSEAVARAMAEGALARAGVDLAVAITGVAGPGGGTAAKPVGLVHFAAAARGRSTLHERRNFGDIGRHQVRMQSVEVALALLEQQIGPPSP